MAIGEVLIGRQSPFESLLDELEQDDSPPTRAGASCGAERIWPGACPAAPGQSYFQGGAVESLYAESQGRPDFSPAEKPPAPSRSPNFRDIQQNIEKELAAAHTLDELRRLRRRCALAAHPDRAGALERPIAEQLMAEVNAAIDRAIKEKTFRAPTP